MGRSSDKKARIDLDGPVGGLTSNPFASLARSAEKSPMPEAPAKECASAEPPTGGTVEVRYERKGHGGKEATVVRWLSDSPDASALRELSRSCARALGAGVRGGADSLVIQGRQVDRVAAYLEDVHGMTVRRGAS